jgi:hypothetical protein
MKAIRVLPCVLIVILVSGFLTGCKKGPSEEELKLAELQQQFATIQQESDALMQARADLAAAQTTVAELEAIGERKRTDEQKQLLDEAKASLDELMTAQDTAFETLQAGLAEFLNVALNEFPQAPETKQALDIYSREALLVADDIVHKAGDYSKASDQLQGAVMLYEQVGLEPNPDLVAKIKSFDEWRFITQERFDAVKNGMTKDEVREIAGVPYYANIQTDTAKGVETWLYRKRDGGAAAIYFKIKGEKVYGKNFEALKVKVTE